MARRERRRERSREEIVDAARRVLLRDGVTITLDAVAREVGVTKAAIYYYYASKDALLFDVVYSLLSAHYQQVHDAVAETRDGPEALGAVIRATVEGFRGRMDDFRLAFLHAQIAGPSVLQLLPEHLERIRPLNDLAFAEAAQRVGDGGPRGRADVDPRLMVFLANVSALGLLTMKGLVESQNDPLRYTDEELIEGLSRIFAAAAEPKPSSG